MKHFKFAHIAIGSAILGTTGAIAWVVVLAPPMASGSGAGAARVSEAAAAAARKPEHLSEPQVNVTSDAGSSPRVSMTPDRDVPPVFNVSIKGPAQAPHGDFGGGGGTGNGIAPLFVANAGPQIDVSDNGTGGADLRSQVGGPGGHAFSTDTGGPGGGGGIGPSAPPGGDPGSGSGSASNPSTGVTTAATMTTSGNLDIAGGFTDVVPTGGNWTVGQDLNVGSSGTASSALSTSGAVKVSGSLNVGNPNGTPATVVIGTTGSIAVSNAVNVYVNSQLQVNGSLTGAQAINVLGGDAQINVPTYINALNLTAGQVGGTAAAIVTGSLNITGASEKSIAGPLTNGTLPNGTLSSNAMALWSGAGNILLGNGGSITNYGTFVVESSGKMSLRSDATGSSMFVNQAGAVFKADSQATATLEVPYVNYGQVSVQDATLTFANGYTQGGISSRTAVGDGGTISSAQPLVFKGGYIKGSGTYAADIQNSGATLAAGASPGHLTIVGNYSQSSTATSGGIFNEQIEGAVPGTLYDVVTVQGVATLGGTLQVTTLNGFIPTPTQSYMFLEATTIQQDLNGLLFGKHVGDKIDVMTDVTDTPGVTPTKVGTFILEFKTDSTTGMQELILDKFDSGKLIAPPPPAPVPEPAALALLGLGALSLLKRRNRR